MLLSYFWPTKYSHNALNGGEEAADFDGIYALVRFRLIYLGFSPLFPGNIRS